MRKIESIFLVNGCAANPAAGKSAIAHAVTRLLAAIVDGQRRARERDALAALDDRLLADMGLSRRVAEDETRKPFWRP
jgi:uncharacterized protein YjiS (DUF1127 family)